MHHRLHRAATAALVGALVAPWAHADCIGGLRQLRPGEGEFYNSATAALVAAIPPAPASASMVGKHDLTKLNPKGPECHDAATGSSDIYVIQRYELPPPVDEARRKAKQYDEITDQILALLKLPPELRAEQEALDRKANDTEKQRQIAMKAGDTSTARTLAKEIESYNRAYREVKKRHVAAVKPQTDALEEQRKPFVVESQRVEIFLWINREKLPAAGNGPDGAYGADSPAKSASLKVVNVAWFFDGPDTPLRRALVDALDREWLKGLVGKPLPSLADSQAKAARATAAVAPPPAGLAEVKPVAVAGPPTPAPPSLSTAAPAATPAPPAPAPAPVATNTTPAAASPSDKAAIKATDAVNKAAEGLSKLRGLLGR
jgi:hypothetical protein